MSTLTPSAVFDAFNMINKVPRPSKHEEKMVQFLIDYAKSLGLPVKSDKVGNVLISKPATAGYENKPIVVLQSHIDMVCEKNAQTEFDFFNDAIKTSVEGEWLTACGTTLGADDGIGVAMQMALLSSNDIEHGPIECLFTVDEETGLTGAENLEPGFFKGKLLINLDSEDEGQIFVSCAGGARTNADFYFTPASMPDNQFAARMTIKGLLGGHSGDDIDKGRANANKLLVRFLVDWLQQNELHLIDIQAGGLHNAIPREATCVIAIPYSMKEKLCVAWNIYVADIEKEFGTVEKSMSLTLQSEDISNKDSIVPDDVAHRMLLALHAVHNGVYAMCQGIDLVETSSNLASIRQTKLGVINVITSQRSSIESARVNISSIVRATFDLAGAKTETTEGYPGWAMNPNSEILRVAKETYIKLFGKEPLIRGIHAGLECGLFSQKYPGLDMISIGPTLRGVHSPDERLLISTVDMVWRHLTEILHTI